MRQPASSCARPNLGTTPWRAPGAGDPRTSGRYRPGARSARHRDHSPDRHSTGNHARLDARLADPARDTDILSRTCKPAKRNKPLQPALPANCRETTGRKIRSVSSSPPYADPGGSDVIRRQVIRTAGAVSWTRAPTAEQPAGLVSPNEVAHGGPPFPPGHSAERARARPYKAAPRGAISTLATPQP
jgi:hypothetical protein